METRSPPRHTLPKEEFCSKNGSLIVLGRFKNHDANPGAVYKNTLIVQDTSSKPWEHVESFAVENKGGLRQTRFGKGFERRNETSISNPVRDIRQEHSDVLRKRADLTATVRETNLKIKDSFSGFDIINCAPKIGPGNFVQPRPEGLKTLGDGLGSEAPKRANILLRDSPSRFFTPHPSGPSQDYRQHVIVNDGCFAPRASSIIQLGKKDIPSAGVEDQFSKSQYTSNSDRAQYGLAEMRVPGRFNPSKQAGNPSGDLSTTASWGKGIDLNNRAANMRSLDTSKFY